VFSGAAGGIEEEGEGEEDLRRFLGNGTMLKEDGYGSDDANGEFEGVDMLEGNGR
jgi:hypothetical protein